MSPPLSHHGVVRPAAPFRARPEDVVEGILDLAGLAVQAVGRVELEPRPPPLDRLHLVDLPGAEARARAAQGVPAAGHAELAVGDEEMAGLVLFVRGAREVDSRELVEVELP